MNKLTGWTMLYERYGQKFFVTVKARSKAQAIRSFERAGLHVVKRACIYDTVTLRSQHADKFPDAQEIDLRHTKAIPENMG